MLNIALPKGRLGDQVYELLASDGYDCKSIYDENRKLVFENPQTGVRYLLVKPSDVQSTSSTMRQTSESSEKTF